MTLARDCQMACSPADLSYIYSLLQNALQQDESLRKPAEAALAACENRPGFCSCLLEIIASKDLEQQSGARWLAAVYFKNSISRYWRTKRDWPGVSDAEKPHLRGKLLELLREKNNQVASQLSLLVSKIARFDYPREWPELFPNLVQKLQSPDVLQTQRIYMALNQILKELSSKRLAADQRNFSEITSQLFDLTWHHWWGDTQWILQEFSKILSNSSGGEVTAEQGQALLLTCERWLLCLKTLRRMILFGFPSDEKSVQEVAQVKQVTPPFLQAVQSLLLCRVAAAQDSSFHGFIEKACLKLMKTLNDIQVAEETWERGPFELFLIQCMVFLQSVIQCSAYRPNKSGRVLGASIATIEEAKATLARQAEATVQALLVDKHMLVLCEVLIRRYFVLTSDDLEDWARDSEIFHHQQGLIQAKEKLRPCAETLYLGLFEKYREILAPLVVQLLKQASDGYPLPNHDAEIPVTAALLYKEAAYNAVGTASYDLYDYIDFKSWYDGALAQDICNPHPNNRILRRRVALLLGQWVSKIKDGLRRPVYSALLRLLGDNDLAVQLAACQSFRHLIDDVHFYEEDFLDFVPDCLQLLMHIMHKSHEFDSKHHVFELVSLIIERLGEKVLCCVDKILLFLPQVWQESTLESLLRIQVLLALQRLMTSLGPHSPICYDLLFPILQHCTDVNQPDELSVLEDGIQLWLTTLKNAPAMVPQLLELFPHLTRAMEKTFDHLMVAMQIIESYILLGGANFLREHAAGVVKILDLVVGNVKEKGMMCTLPIIDMLIQCFPREASPLLEGVLQKLVILVVSGQSESDLVRASAGAVLARVLVQNSMFFAQLTSQPSLTLALKQRGVNVEPSALFLFIDACLDKVDSLTTSDKRKVCALALCIMLTLREPQILDRLEQILSVCASVLQDTEEDGNGNVLSSDFGVGNPTIEGAESEDSRKSQVIHTDPVKSLALAPMLKEKLNTCAVLHGEAAFNAAMSRLHPSLLSQLQQFMLS